MALLPDVTSFPYGRGIGTPSWQNIISLAKTASIPFNVTSTVRIEQLLGHPDYHNTGNAVDVAASPQNMIELARWFQQNYTPYLLELIHSGGGGFFVKNGRQVDASYYGSSTVSQHYNHVHIAMTNDGYNAASGHPSTTPDTTASLTSISNPLEPLTKVWDAAVNPGMWYRTGLIVVGAVGIVAGVSWIYTGG